MKQSLRVLRSCWAPISYWALVSYAGVTKIRSRRLRCSYRLPEASLKYNAPAMLTFTPHVMRSVNKLRHKAQKPGNPVKNTPSK